MADDIVTIGSRRPHIARSRVLIIHVGGIWGMQQDEAGGLTAPKRGMVAHLLHSMHDLEHETMPEHDLLEYDELHDSSDTEHSDWVRLANDIYKRYNDYDGFLILHGTDTIVNTACALSMLLKNLSKAVVLTGGLLPLSDPNSDSTRHVTLGLLFACEPFLSEVSILFADTLLRGNCTIKSRLTNQAFVSPNSRPLAKASAFTYGFSVDTKELRNQPSDALAIPNDTFCDNVLCVSVDVDTDFEAISAAIKSMGAKKVKDAAKGAADSREGARKKKVKPLQPNVPHSLVCLECNANAFESVVILSQIEKMISQLESRQVMLVIGSNALDGAMVIPSGMKPAQRDAYESLRRSEHIFVVDKSAIMTHNAALLKAMYLVGMERLTASQLKRAMAANLRGEVAKSSSGFRGHL